MESEKLKISVAQRILSLSDDRLLKKISDILNEEDIVEYDAHGNPISKNGYVEDINSALLEFKEGTMEAYTSEEIKRRILNDENIVGYDSDGNPVTHEEFVEDLEDTLKKLEEGTLETYTTEEVRQMIFGK